MVIWSKNNHSCVGLSINNKKTGVVVLFRLCGLFFICCLLSVQGCKTSKKKDLDSDNQGDNAVTAPFAVNGRVNSGSLLQSDAISLISLHPVVKGKVHLAISVAETNSDTSGNYQLTVAPKYYNQPAVIRAYIAGSGVELLLAVPKLAPSYINNITLLTHLAASRLLQFSALGSTVQAVIAITDANTQVANRFGIIGDLASSPLVNINDQNEWASSTSYSIRYSGLGRAILEAVVSDHPNLASYEAIEQFTSAFAVFGMVANSVNDEVTSYFEILTELQVLVRGMKQNDVNEAVLDRVLIELATDLGLSQVEASDLYEKGYAASSSGLSYVDKAKTLVEDLRQIVSSIDIESIVGLSNISKLLGNKTPIATQLEGFGIQVDVSELVSGDEFGHIQKALTESAFAVMEELGCYYQPTSCKDLDSSSVVVNRISQRATENKWVSHEVSIKQSLDVCPEEAKPCIVKIDLTLILNLDTLAFGVFQDGQLQDITLARGDITLNGTLSQNGLTLSLDASQPQIHLGSSLVSLSPRGDGQDNFDSIFIAMESTVVNMPIDLYKNDSQNVRAVINSNIGAVKVELTDTVEKSYFSSGSVTTTESEVVVSQLKGFEINIAGVVNNLTGENFLVSLNLAQPGLGFSGNAVYYQTTVEDCKMQSGELACTQTDLGSGFSGESSDENSEGEINFIKLDASIGYKAKLKGVADPVMVQLSGSRVSPDLNTINGLRVTYPGHSLNVFGEFNKNGKVISMGAENIEGITMTVNSDENGKRYGDMRGPDGTKLADIVPTSNLVKITFIDGRFVSLIL